MASVLETFLILFESNADDVDKGNKKAAQSSEHLESKLNATDAAAHKVGESFTHMIAEAGGALAAILSVGAIVEGVFSAAETNDKLLKFSERLDLNIEDVNAWGDAVKVSGGSAEGFQGTVDGLTEALTTFAVKGMSRVAPFFKELGIKMVDAHGKARNVMDLLPELADSFSKLSKQESSSLGKKIGLDQGTITLLQMGRREVNAQIAQQKELGTVTKVNAEKAEKFNDAFDNTAKVFRSLFTVVGGTILPVFTSILEGVQKVAGYLSKHSHFIIGLLIALGTAIAVYVLPPLYSMAAAAIVAFAPFLLIGLAVAAAAAAFALLYDDVMNFIEGNNSFIGQILTQYPMIGEVINALVAVVKGLWSAVSWVFESILDILQIAGAGWKILFGTIYDGIASFVEGSSVMQGIIETITAAFSVMGEAIGAVWDYIGERAQSFIDLIRSIIGVVKSIAGGISGVLGSAKAALGIDVTQGGKDALAVAGATPIGAQTSNSIANSSKSTSKSTSVQVGKVEVHTQATDAEGIAGAIGSTMGQQIKQAAGTFDDGVTA